MAEQKKSKHAKRGRKRRCVLDTIAVDDLRAKVEEYFAGCKSISDMADDDEGTYTKQTPTVSGLCQHISLRNTRLFKQFIRAADDDDATEHQQDVADVLEDALLRLMEFHEYRVATLRGKDIGGSVYWLKIWGEWFDKPETVKQESEVSIVVRTELPVKKPVGAPVDELEHKGA